MTPVLIGLLGLAVGWLGHGTRPVIDRLSRGWRELTASGVGILLIYPIYLMGYRHDHPEEAGWFVRANLIFWGAVMPVGIAVSAAWLLDTAQERDK